MPPPVTGQSTHSSVQFLNNVLSQRGPSALPYDEEVKWLIRQHLVSVIQEYPSLQAKTAIFNHNDGRTVNLLQAEGTVPMYYQEVMYNIPVIIWLLESYPRQAPCVYVTPTRDMIIKRGHPHVNASGMVSIPYLQTWVFPSSNLVDLVRNLSQLFGQDPPLYTKHSAPQPRPSPTPSHTQSAQMNHSHGAHIASSSSPLGHNPNAHGALVRPPGPPRGYAYNRLPPSPQRLSNADDPSEVFRRNAINRLVESLHTDMIELRKATEVEMDGLFNTQAELRQREEQLEKGLREMQDEKEGLEQQLQLILTNTDVLDSWLRCRSIREMLQAFLLSSDKYDAEAVLELVKASELWPEQAILYRKLGEETLVLQILALKLEDSEAAEQYCAELGRPDAYMQLLDMYLEPGDGKEPMYKAAVRLLHCHGESLDPLQVLEALSPDMPLQLASETLSRMLRARVHHLRQGQIVHCLCRAVNLDARLSRFEERSRQVQINDESLCDCCHSRLGTKLFAMYPNDSVVCYKCFKRYGEHICPVTGRDFEKNAMFKPSWLVRMNENNSGI